MPADFIHYIILYCLVRAEEGVYMKLAMEVSSSTVSNLSGCDIEP